MAKRQFQIGDLVQLKSGGPKMTVNASYSDYIECAWFTGAKSNKANFKAEALQDWKEEEEETGGTARS